MIWLERVNREFFIFGLMIVVATTLTAKDAKCSLNNGISGVFALTASITGTTEVSCNGRSDGSISATASGGIMPYTYLWSSGNIGPMANNLAAGVYTVTVTDASGATDTAAGTVFQPNALSAWINNVTNTSCNGASNGTATAGVSGGNQPYTYLWDNGTTTYTTTYLNAGQHGVTVTDAKGCVAEAQAIIQEPNQLSINDIIVDSVACFGEMSGNITLAVSGGISPYRYEWNNSSTNLYQSNLSAGVYSLTVTDANNCTNLADIPVYQPDMLSLILTNSSNITCNSGADGTASVTPNGGISPYLFLWDNGTTSSNINQLTAGFHGVTVTDFNQCTSTMSVQLTEPDAVILSVGTLRPVTCNGLSDGRAEILAAGGAGNYTYLWDNGETRATASTLNAGPHTVSVYDGQGCLAEETIFLAEPPLLGFGASTVSQAACTGDDGSILVAATGGTAPYFYSWNTGEMTASINDLSAGDYTVTATDANNCTTTQTITINQPANPLGAHVNPVAGPVCAASADGRAEAVANGGLPPYSYLWDNGEQSAEAIMLDGGLHLVTITDGGGCSLTASVLLDDPAPIRLLNGLIINPVSCFGGADGEAIIELTGGTAPYLFTWNGGSPIYQNTLSGLSQSVYSVEVTDVRGCKFGPVSITVNEPEPLALELEAVNPLCASSDDGYIAAVTSGGSTSYTYQWSNGDFKDVAYGLDAGNYSVTVIDGKGCRAAASASLVQPSAVYSSLNVIGNKCFGETEGAVLVENTLGGMAPYVYALDSDFFTPDTLFDGLSAGNYELTTQDANGCLSVLPVAIEEPGELTVSAGEDFTVDLGENGQLAGSVTNGTGSVSLSWSPADALVCLNGDTSLQCVDPIVPLLAENKSFTLTAMDENGCVATDEVMVFVEKNRSVFVPNAFTPNGDESNDLFYLQSDYSVSVVRVFRVFDRWGQLVFEAQDFPADDSFYGWDGFFKGKLAPMGVYLYSAELEYIDGETEVISGDVTLLR